MTATEKAKRSDALYYETVSVTRRVLCDMIANREADLEDARAENAKLRDGAYAMRQLYEDELKHALAENAKLRELVRAYERCTMHADCSRCEYDGKLSTHCPLSPCFPDADELRELGVEVDG